MLSARFAVRTSSVTPEPNTWDRVDKVTPRNHHAHLLKLKQRNCNWANDDCKKQFTQEE
jgi:hypothetical protein